MKTSRTLLLVALLAGPLAAQPVMTQNGHALDANPGIGSRINPTANPNANPGASGQYIMTGEAPMGRSFHGFVPYNATDQFETTIPSAALYDFHRDSIGLPLIMRTGGDVSAIQAQPYLTSTRTVLRAGQVNGGSYLNSGTGPGVINPFALPSYQIPPSPITNRLAAPPWQADYYAPLFAALVVPDMPLADQIDYRRDMLTRYPGLLPLGVVPPEPGQTPTQPVAPPLPRPGQIELSKPETGIPLPVQPGAERIEPMKPAPETPPGQTPNETPSPGRETGNQAEGGQSAAQGQKNLLPGQDLYLDLLKRAESIPENPAPPSVSPAGAGQPGTGSAGTSKSAGPPESTLPTLQEQLAAIMSRIKKPNSGRMATRTVVSSRNGGQADRSNPAAQPTGPVNLAVRYPSLASSLPTMTNALIREAEGMLNQRRFYDALKDLAQAKALDPQNPLIWLRSSQAYFGAGEFLSATGDLQRAMQLFPSVISVQAGLPGLSAAGGARLLADRISQLEQLARRGDNPDLWMLLCYIQYAVGGSDAAAPAARRVLKSDSASPQAKALAGFVLPFATPTTGPGE